MPCDDSPYLAAFFSHLVITTRRASSFRAEPAERFSIERLLLDESHVRFSPDTLRNPSAPCYPQIVRQKQRSLYPWNGLHRSTKKLTSTAKSAPTPTLRFNQL